MVSSTVFMYFPHHHLNHFSSGDNFWTIFWTAAGVIVTFLAILVALFQERFWSWWRQPVIDAVFDSTSERCSRWGIVPKDMLMDQGTFANVKRHYFRLRVTNTGLTTVHKLRAKVELYDPEKNELADRFEPTALNWITGSQSIDLAPKEDDYLNLISQVLEPKEIKYKLRLEIADHTFRAIAWDRYIQIWKLQVTFYADNLPNPVVKYYKFIPTADGSVGRLEQIA